MPRRASSRLPPCFRWAQVAERSASERQGFALEVPGALGADVPAVPGPGELPRLADDVQQLSGAL